MPGGQSAKTGTNNPADEENISGPENEHSEASGLGGGHRFENLIKSMLARLELHGSLAPIQQYGRHQRKANTRKKAQSQAKKGTNGNTTTEGQATAAVSGPGGMEKPEANGSGEKKEVQYDDKFYDLDDGWICDDDNLGLNDDGVADFVIESESQSVTNTMGQLSGAVVDEEQRMRRLEKKEMERIANRFKVITPAEFERNLGQAKENGG